MKKDEIAAPQHREGVGCSTLYHNFKGKIA